MLRLVAGVMISGGRSCDVIANPKPTLTLKDSDIHESPVQVLDCTRIEVFVSPEGSYSLTCLT